MTPEATAFFQNADDQLARGQTMLATGLNYEAGRAAYLAAFQAAQAMLFERSGKKEATDAIEVARTFVATVRRVLEAQPSN